MGFGHHMLQFLDVYFTTSRTFEYASFSLKLVRLDLKLWGTKIRLDQANVESIL